MDNNERYEVILADPPWKQSKGGKKSVRSNSSGRPLDYLTMDLDGINEILRGASSLGSTDHAFFIWTIDKYLHEAEAMLRNLGYRLHARMIWNKVTGIPAAFTVRYGHEYLLWFYKERLLPVALDERGKIHTVFTEQVGRHSRKPEISYNIIERLYPNARRLELFAREARPNWNVWGNEVSCDVSLSGYQPKNFVPQVQEGVTVNV